MEYTGMKNVLKEFLNRIIKDDSTTTKNTWSASKTNSELKTKMNSSVTHLSGDVPTSRKINNKELSSDITLSASDIGAVPTSRTVNNKALSSNISLSASDVGAITKSDLLDFVYPVGSIYMSVNNVSPQTFLGGTWIRINGRFLLGAGANTANTDNTYGSLAANQINRSVNEQGGEVTHKLTIAEMPSHSHKVYIRRASDEALGYGATVSGAFQNRLIVTGSYDFGLDSSTEGNGSAHNNMPPYLVVYMWKRTA